MLACTSTDFCTHACVCVRVCVCVCVCVPPQAEDCVLDVAHNLRVTLDPEKFTVHVAHREGPRVFAGPYDLFFFLGNEKYPQVKGIGKVRQRVCDKV